ncbi:MAG: DUF3394 domain-containing protein, partial [Proteobacteria bacterium]|nr:DUF3394 domain-containing protein [Pseudomonadota bacterium]
WAAVKLGATGYIVPFMFAFSPSLLMIGSWTRVGLAVVTALIGVICLAGSLHRYFLSHMTHWERVVLFVAAFALIKPGLMTDLVGIGLLLLVLVSQYFGKMRKKKA